MSLSSLPRVLSSIALCLAGSLALAATPPAWPPELLDDREALLDQLIEDMTLDEKIGQLRLISIGADMPHERLREEIAAGRVGGTFNSVTRHDNRPLQQAAVEDSRLGIPIFFAYDVVHGHRTIFPIGPGLASTWNPEAIAITGEVMAREAAADGLDMSFAPVVDITRDPRWGRTSEGFGEDPHLVSEIARAMVRSMQGGDPAQADRIMASVKHFALYGAVEGGRDYNVVDMSPLRMYQDYLPPYRAAVEEGAGAVMVALNAINGVPASANRWLLRDLLRDEWGFQGVTISDHGAITELLRHGVAADDAEAARLALAAGLDMSMADTLFGQELPGLLERGDVEPGWLDQAVRNVLRTKYDLGLFHDPYRRIGQAADDPADVNDEGRLHRAEARRVAQQSLVLLENHDRALPLSPTAKVALVGPLADSQVDMLGSWSAAGRREQAVTLWQGMRAAAREPGWVRLARGANVTDDPAIVEYLNFLNWDTPEVVQDERDPQAMIDEALALAREADVIVAAVGEARGMSHESSSRTSLDIPASQQRLLEALAATGKPLVLVLLNGRPLDLGWAQEHAAAILEAWYPGTEGGHAIADVLYGEANPSGKLPLSFPRSVGHIPAHYNHARLGRPFTEGKPGNYTSQYFDQPNGPRYAFGHGLSYTEFELDDPRLSRPEVGAGETLEAVATVRNTGDRRGATVVQWYLRDEAASVVRPVKELKHFERVELAPGESREVRMIVDDDVLAFYNAELERVVEPGAFELQVGLDSQAVLSAGFVRR
ncbi:MAG: beta-glucosidase BglX [Pigmentiphaga sp.]|nr:beta-glucosidase BglX [Pigmentiphaga sp.]